MVRSCLDNPDDKEQKNRQGPASGRKQAPVCGLTEKIPLDTMGRSALVCAGGDALDVELLHDDEQNGNGDGHQHAACAEQRKIVVDQRTGQHVVQADGHCPVGTDAGVEDHLCHDKVGPGHHEGVDDGVDQNRLGHGNDNLEEDARFRRTVQFGSLPQRDGHRVKEALADQIAKAGGTGIDHDQAGVRVGQVQIPQHEVDGDHGQHAGEQIDGDRQVLQKAPALEPAAAESVGNHQHKAGGDDAVEDGDDQRVHEPLGKLGHAVGVEQDIDVVVQRVSFGEKVGEVDAPVAGEGCDHQP